MDCSTDLEGALESGAESAEQWAAWWGDEAAALAHAARSRDIALDLSGATCEDGVAAIAKASAGRRVVMINEAHVASRHRLFIGQVLQALRPLGFTHYAAEAFSNLPPMPSVESLRPGDQVGQKQGYFIADPVFAETVRQALDLGYGLVGYEAIFDPNTHLTPQESIVEREASQTANLIAALDRWPNGRFLVHVGYGHLSKIPDPGGNLWFAARFKAGSAIDPLCISQDASGSFGPHAPDSPATQSVLTKFAPRAPIIVRSANGTVLNNPRMASDMSVYHPNLPDVAGRPGWLAADRDRRATHLRLSAPINSAPTLAQAIRLDDKDPAIPADQYLAPAGERRLTFYLRPGRYRARLETKDGFMALGELRV
jgi:hypothetical protein